MDAPAAARYDAFVRAAARCAVAVDFDGTIAPIVDDPAAAHIHPDAVEAFLALAPHVAALAVITGRPARQALDLGGLEQLAHRAAAVGTPLLVFGQYGNERWSSSQPRIVSPRPPAGLASFERELPRLLRTHDAAGAHLEDKGLAVAIHTRRLPDAAAAFERLRGPVQELADRYGLVVEPGRQVLEVRSPGMDKGVAVRTLMADLDLDGLLYAGDDLGDLEAFHAVRALADTGAPTLLVFSASGEESALRDLADLSVPGPTGVVALLRRLADDAQAAQAAAPA
ncbi:trehalose-phosphatase [Nocardioides sp.]|uniref:trehalose-phosphatase n=1 Tax=Nocardioides sp. TaxID=35761 RepID=UPI0035169733